MKTTKLNLRAGEKGRLEIAPNIGVDPQSVKWSTVSNCVVLDPSQQKTPFDMRVVATGEPGMAYVEVEAQITNQDRKLHHVFEIHNEANETGGEFQAFARLSRSYRRKGEQQQQPTAESVKDSVDETGQTSNSAANEKPAASDATDSTQTMRMNSDNPIQSAGLPAKAPQPDGQVIEPLPVNDATTTSLGGTIGSPAFGSGKKPTATVVGIDTITPEENGKTELPESRQDEKLEDRAKVDEALKNAAENSEALIDEAKKLPSETELSGETKDTIIEPPHTVPEDDSRRTNDKTNPETAAEKDANKKAAADKTVADKVESEKPEKKSDSSKSDKPDSKKTEDKKSDAKQSSDKKEIKTSDK